MSDKRREHLKEDWITEPENEHRHGKLDWLRSRAVLLVGLAILAILLVAIGSGKSQASIDQNIFAARQQKNLPSPGEYQFTGQGKLSAGSAETWIVGGVPVLINGQTQSEGTIHPGEPVSLVGHILENGDWAVERIVPIDEEESFFSFAGPLDSTNDDIWQVAGIALDVDENSVLGKAIPIGEFVLATFQVQPDGSWLALQIQALSALEKERTPTVTPTPTITPTPTASPTASQKSAPNDSSTGSSGLVTVCHKPNLKKGGQTLVLEQSALNGHLKHGDTLGACR